jgi:2'-5' RNA ligase
VRLFVAIEIPEPVCREVKRRVAGLRDRLPRARWVDPEVLHLTLLFLGEVAAERVEGLATALRAAFAPVPPLGLRLRGAGTFPPGRPARVAWVGVEGPAELAALQAGAVAAAVTSAGHQPEERPYRPHITLARCQAPWPRAAVEKFVSALPGEIGPPFTAHRGVLIESKLSPRGARYREVAELPLGGEETAGAGEGAAAEPACAGEAPPAEEPAAAEEAARRLAGGERQPARERLPRAGDEP